MPVFNHETILDLQRTQSKLGRFQRLFFPSQLAHQLSCYPKQNPTIQDQLAVFKAFEKKTWFFQKWFFTSLWIFDKNDYTKAVHPLNTEGLFKGKIGQANRNAMHSHLSPLEFGNAFDCLQRAGLLAGKDAQANFNAIIAHQRPYGVALALCILHSAGLLTGQAGQANRDAIVAQQSPYYVAKALGILHRAGLLKGDEGQANFNAVVITYTAIFFHPNNHQNRVTLWHSIPNQRLSATEFEAMLTIARANAANPNAGSTALWAYVQTLILGNRCQQPAFNDKQSTPTANVHSSVFIDQTSVANNRYGVFHQQNEDGESGVLYHKFVTGSRRPAS